MADRDALIKGFLRRNAGGKKRKPPSGAPNFPTPASQAASHPGKLPATYRRERISQQGRFGRSLR